MVCLVVATVVQGVVEMVVKFGGEDGFLDVFLVKEVEEDGVEVLLLLEMEEEMEENEVEGFVVEKMDLVGGGNGLPRELGGFVGCWSLLETKEMKENERERRSRGVIYKR